MSPPGQLGMRFTISLCVLSSPFLMTAVSSENFPFRDVTLPWDERVDDLIYRLTPEEVIAQLSHGGVVPNVSNPAPPIPRLGIGRYSWATECLRGDLGNATAFPDPITTAATFSTDLLHAVSEAVGIEVRAKNNNFTAHGDYAQHKGLSCFSPVVNIMRHPTWGRNQETYGEDPYLTGQYARAYITGLQGKHPRYVMASSGCKSFDAYTGPEDIPSSRFSFNAEISERDWRQTFLPAFRECVRAGTFSLMCSYNGINGVPACANEKLLTTILRHEWGFKGYVVSDMEAIRNLMTYFHYTKDEVTTAAVCLKAGCNLELSGPWVLPHRPVYTNLSQALEAGLVDKALLYERVRPLFYTRMRLGEFDPPAMNPFLKLKPQDWVQSPKHRELAIQVAAKGIILLKNEGSVLPVEKSITAAVVGPFADDVKEVYGNYSPDFDPKFAMSPLAALKRVFSDTSYAAGCQAPRCRQYNASDVAAAVKGKDLVVVCLGTGTYEHEGEDRPSMALPGNQTRLLLDVIANTRAPIVVVLFSCGPVSLPPQAWAGPRAVLQLGFPAQSAGEALARVMTGLENPAGRLPYTWYASLDQLPGMTNYSMEGRTYRYIRSTPLFPFGYGLSYSRFRYSGLEAWPAKVTSGQDVEVSVTVTNDGPRDGDEVAQLYLSWPPGHSSPVRQLVGFSRLFLQRGASQRLTWSVTAEQMALWADGGYWAVPTGVYGVWAGGQQPGQDVTTPSNVLSASVTVSDN